MQRQHSKQNGILFLSSSRAAQNMYSLRAVYVQNTQCIRPIHALQIFLFASSFDCVARLLSESVLDISYEMDFSLIKNAITTHGYTSSYAKPV